MNKCQLNEYCQKSYISAPYYDTEIRCGLFISEVTVDVGSYVSSKGHGRKKDAEEDAAGVALQELDGSRSAILSQQSVPQHSSLPPASPVAVPQHSSLPPASPVANGMNKCQLNEYCQKSYISAPHYDTGRRGGLFISEVTVKGGSYVSSKGHGRKKDAEEDAAGVALQELDGSRYAIPSQQSVVPGYSSLPTKIPTSYDVAVPKEMNKCQLNEYCQKSYISAPHYDTGMRGVLFFSEVTVKGESYVSSKGHGKKKDAEEDAAGVALQELDSSRSAIQSQQSVMPTKIPASRGGVFEGILLGSKPHYLQPVLPFSLSPGLSVRKSHYSPVLSPGGSGPPSQPKPAVPLTPSRSPSPPLPAPVSLPLKSVLPTQQAVVNFDEELEWYCQVRGLASPTFNVTEKKGCFRGAVIVNGVEYVGCDDQPSFVLAKKTACLVALASIGIQALRWQEQVAGAPSGQSEEVHCQQQHSGSVSPLSSTSEATLSECLARLKLPAETSTPPVVVPRVVASSALQLQQNSVLYSDNSAQISPHSASTSFTQSQQTLENLNSGTTKSQSIGLALKMSNYKSALNFYCHKKGFNLPRYSCTFPEDAVGYIATVLVNGQKFTSGAEGTKRAAESMAACKALDSFGESVGGPEMGNATNGESVKNGQLEPASSIPAEDRNISYKNLLQEYLQKSCVLELPRYTTEQTEDGFVSTVALKISPEKSQRYRGQPHGNKKAAEQDSAKAACHELKLVT